MRSIKRLPWCAESGFLLSFFDVIEGVLSSVAWKPEFGSGTDGRLFFLFHNGEQERGAMENEAKEIFRLAKKSLSS